MRILSLSDEVVSLPQFEQKLHTLAVAFPFQLITCSATCSKVHSFLRATSVAKIGQSETDPGVATTYLFGGLCSLAFF